MAYNAEMRRNFSIMVIFSAACALAASGGLAQQEGKALNQSTNASNAPELIWNLDDPQFNPSSCPDWARVQTPDWLDPYRGKNGTPEPYRSMQNPLGSASAGIDRYQGNQFVNYRPETAAYLYSEYTPTEAHYKAGSLPSYEALVAKYTNEGMSETEQMLALLTGAIPAEFPHSHMPPRGKKVPPNRNLMDEELLATGSGWCNEQARVLVRLCQVAGMQGRIIHLFGQSHTVAEIFADGRWVFVDATNIFVARGSDGQLLSASAVHDGGEGQRAYAEAKKQRLMQMHDMPAAELGVTSEEEMAKHQASWQAFDVEKIASSDELSFGVINYPLPFDARTGQQSN